MILIDKTVEDFGYNPLDLTPQSNRKIWARCENCKTERLIIRYGYVKLCHKCSNRPNNRIKSLKKSNITLETVQQIKKELREDRRASSIYLSAKYNVKYSLIRDIKKGVSYKNV